MKPDKLHINLPAEWAPQSGVQLTWPHEKTDWKNILNEVIPCFAAIANEIAKREKLLIVCHDKEVVKSQLGENINQDNVLLIEMESNDTWARDHGGISVFVNNEPYIYDFCFNGWGMKFPANNLAYQVTAVDIRQKARLNETAVAEHRVLIGYGEDFRQPVRHINDPGALG